MKMRLCLDGVYRLRNRGCWHLQGKNWTYKSRSYFVLSRSESLLCCSAKSIWWVMSYIIIDRTSTGVCFQLSIIAFVVTSYHVIAFVGVRGSLQRKLDLPGTLWNIGVHRVRDASCRLIVLKYTSFPPPDFFKQNQTPLHVSSPPRSSSQDWLKRSLQASDWASVSSQLRS